MDTFASMRTVLQSCAPFRYCTERNMYTSNLNYRHASRSCLAYHYLLADEVGNLYVAQQCT
eukprot:scaffold272281_cov22-Prasinocladus_malaysianus.AAC.1